MGQSRKRERTQVEISPDEIFIDAHNLPEFGEGHLEGRMERLIPDRSIALVGWLCTLVALGFLLHLFTLQVLRGESYRALARDNTLREQVLVAPRGLIYDRVGRELAWNSIDTDAHAEGYTTRAYATTTGLAHLLGYVRLPQRDSKGKLYSDTTEGIAGVEQTFDALLAGENGRALIETDARMDAISRGVLQAPQPGKSVTLSIDAHVQSLLFEVIRELAHKAPFQGGAGALMDIETGELLALTSYPEYSNNVMMSGDVDQIALYEQDEHAPYLNRAIAGVYTPGSIVKPYFAAAALNEGIVRADTTFISTGSIFIANPYRPGEGSRFTDWRAHGAVDMRRALAVSSNVYFYYIGGGFGTQKGLGITRLEAYARKFGFGEPTGIALQGEEAGVLPNPEWKKRIFGENEVWRVGDTYNTVIGQYGFQVTPLQALRAVAALANDGKLLTPRVAPASTAYTVKDVGIPPAYLTIVRAGMRDGVLGGTAAGLNVPYLSVAAKTGTAELGTQKQYVNSWVTGFFPYEKPRYAFVVLMERGPRGNLTGATFAMRTFLDRLHAENSLYLQPQ